NNPTSSYTGTVSAGTGFSTTANAHGILRTAASNMIPDAATLQVNGGTFDIQGFTDTVATYRHLGLGKFTGTTGVITSTNSPDLRSGFISGGRVTSANPFIKSGGS